MNSMDLKLRNISEKPWVVRGKMDVPGIIYGRGLSRSIPVKMNYKKFNHKYNKDGEIYKLNLQGQRYIGTIASVQRDPITREIIHFTIQQLPTHKDVDVELPIKFEGFPVGLSKGGVLLRIMDNAEVNGKINQIPDNLKADISKLDIGDVLTVSDLEETQIDIKCDESEVVAVCRPPAMPMEKESISVRTPKRIFKKRKAA